ncbi:peptidase [Paenibacillus sp.]|jgi:Skp family chaperone for outer membrane proteins|uniref:peptidase n=1 Tax=Paenibacillus sp. TaxID=58172 RepID=UPI0028261DDE|nr:peptidase [Paenibacillus sp.]MDR0269735.1 peptidase [Paenibacillus sp.]
MNKFYKVLATGTILAMAAMPMASAQEAHLAICPPGPVTQVDQKKDVSISHENGKQNENKENKQNEDKEKKDHKEDKEHKEQKQDKENKEHKEDRKDKDDKKDKKNKDDKEHKKEDKNKEQQKVLGTLGQITKYTMDANGKYITVVGRGLAPSDQGEVILTITNNTKITNSKGKKVSLEQVIVQKNAVKVFYSPVTTKSLQPSGTATTVIVQDQQMNGIQGKVSQVKNSKIVVTGKNLYTSKKETIVLQLTGNTPIVDQDGKKVNRQDIKPGMTIEAFYGPKMTKSIPAQVQASYIIMKKEQQQLQESGTTGVITEKNNDQITVVGMPAAQGGQKEIKLNVNDNTVIVNEKGESITKDTLKADTNVDVLYSPAMTSSLPPVGNATKIVVKDHESVKVEGTIEKSDTANDNRIYLNVNSDDNKNNDILLNISKETKIVNLRGDETELTPGMKIVAYHSPAMTMSLPGMTNAELIMVISE